MPGICGIETARRIKATHPDMVVVLTSTIVELPSDAESCGASAFVRKQDLGPSLLRRLWESHGGRKE
jgi:two-component system, NarL family, invasion response regulator UvrY